MGAIFEVFIHTFVWPLSKYASWYALIPFFLYIVSGAFTLIYLTKIVIEVLSKNKEKRYKKLIIKFFISFLIFSASFFAAFLMMIIDAAAC